MNGYDEDKARLILELRQYGITDDTILNLMESVPRELFVPDAFREHSYENSALPIDLGQTISQPLIVAMMTLALEVDKRTKVLEIGTGSGYQTVILSHLCRRVYTVERHRGLSKGAEKLFATLNRHNITTKIGDGGMGWPEQAPFSRIIVTAAAADIPPVLVDQLSVGGIMVVPVGEHRDHQDLLKVRKTETGIDVQDLGPVRFVPLLPGRPETQ